MAANTFTAGVNVELSGTGLTGEYALLDKDLIRPEGGVVDWYIAYTLGNSTSVTLTSFCKDADASSSIYFKRMYETGGGTLQQWSSGALAASTNNCYSLSYPKGSVPALCLTFIGGTTGTVVVSAKVAR